MWEGLRRCGQLGYIRSREARIFYRVRWRGVRSEVARVVRVREGRRRRCGRVATWWAGWTYWPVDICVPRGDTGVLHRGAARYWLVRSVLDRVYPSLWAAITTRRLDYSTRRLCECGGLELSVSVRG